MICRADGRRRTLSKLRRKDSGFSESFDDDSCEDRGHVEPERDSSYSSSSSMGNSPPPTPPPRPPPRRTTTTAGDEPPPTTLRQPPPPPSVTREHDQRPPTPPPRPPHTLLGSISLHWVTDWRLTDLHTRTWLCQLKTSTSYCLSVFIVEFNKLKQYVI